LKVPHLASCKYFGKEIDKTADQWKKNDQPDPIIRCFIPETMNDADSLQDNYYGIILSAKKRHNGFG